MKSEYRGQGGAIIEPPEIKSTHNPHPKRRMRGIQNKVLCVIWRALAQKYGLPRARKERVYNRDWTPEFVISADVLKPPIVMRNDKGIVWIDRYYVAYALEGQAGYKYAAISLYELSEEIARLKAESGEKYTANAISTLPPLLRADVQQAYRHMHHTGKYLWISPAIRAGRKRTGRQYE